MSRALAAVLALAACQPGAGRAAQPRDSSAVASPRRPPVDARVAPPAASAVDVGPDPVAFGGALPVTVGRGAGTVTVGGAAREVLTYVPRSRGASPPLLLLFHGTNDTAEAVFTESAAQRVADAHGVVVLAPQAVYQDVSDWDHPDSQGNWWETYPSVDPDTNHDLLLVRALLVAAQRAYGVDPARVYVIGHSNGAFFAQLVANTLGDRVAAWASSSGGLCSCAARTECSFVGTGTSCAALARQRGWCGCRGADKPGPIRTMGRRPAAYLTHGANDDLVSPYFTCALAGRLAAAGFEVETVIRDGEQHVMPDAFAVTVWPWLFRHRRE